MTNLTQPVSRRTAIVTDNRIKVRKRDQFEVTLSPDGSITFRQIGCRKRVSLPLSTVYLLALQEEAASIASDKIASKAAGRGSGLVKRKSTRNTR